MWRNKETMYKCTSYIMSKDSNVIDRVSRDWEWMQTKSSIFMRRDISVVIRLGVLETWVLVSRPVLTSLGLGLGLETSESWSRSRSWSWSLLVRQIQTLGLKWHAYKVLHPLLEKVFCPPVTSAPVERIFSHSGLLMRANRARMRDNMLSQLVYLRCNNKLILGAAQNFVISL